jgi:serine/threonine protein kinase
MNKHDPFIVTEYCANGSLADLLKKSARARAEPEASASPSQSPRALQLPLSNATRLSIGVQILEGLVRLHESAPPIIHRDLKTANILLDQRMNAKIADCQQHRRGTARLHQPAQAHARVHLDQMLMHCATLLC